MFVFGSETRSQDLKNSKDHMAKEPGTINQCSTKISYQ